MPRRLPGRVIGIALAALLLSGPAAAEKSPRAAVQRTTRQIRALKNLQHQLILAEPSERQEKLQELRESRERHELARQRRLPMNEWDRPESRALTPTERARLAASHVAAPANKLVNNPTGEDPSLDAVVQSEVSIAAFGNYMVAVWNDGAGYLSDTSILGFGYSTDGGTTWVDGGAPPSTNIGTWTSDPTVTVDEKTGLFYFAGLCDVSDTMNGVGVVRGSFIGNTFAWGTPVVAIQEESASSSVDKSWIAADSLSGNLYLTYSHFDGSIINAQFVATNDRIRMVRSTDRGATWSSPMTLSNPADDGFVQGSRPAVGPNGEVYAVWQAVGQPSGAGFNSPYGRDYMRIRKSTDFGLSFNSEVTADSVFSNFSNGGPGFNRGSGVTFPSIAVDRSEGAYRGRVYLTWNESLDFYDAPFPPNPTAPGILRAETEPNDGPYYPPDTHIRFNVGQALSGRIGNSPADQDFWRFDGIKGQTIVCYMDQIQSTLNPEFSIRCSDGTVRLGFNNFGVGRRGVLVFTCPKDTVYFVRVASIEKKTTGTYRILTAWDQQSGERARDHRDIFVTSSNDGVTWGPTVRTNDSEGNLDDWLPEVAVDGTGRVFNAHYDYRDEPTVCNAPSNVYLTRSDDGGLTWLPETRLSDVSTNWSTTGFNLEPNQGDYIGLFARDTLVVVGWGDGRPLSMTTTDSDPNVFAIPAPLPSCSHAPVIAADTVGTTRDFIRVTWTTTVPGFAAHVIRQTGGVDADLGLMTADGSGLLVMQDATAQAATTYLYRLETTGFCEPSAAPVIAQLPCLAAPVVTVDGTSITQDSVTVAWSAPPGFTGTLSRREGNGAYVPQFPVAPDIDGKIVYVDRAITPGLSYGYRIDVDGFCKAFVGPVTAAVPPLLLALDVQNPTNGDIYVSFSLTSSSAATIGLFDLSGRMVVARKVENFGPGHHVINMTPGLPIGAGVYFLKLTQGTSTVKRRVAVVN